MSFDPTSIPAIVQSKQRRTLTDYLIDVETGLSWTQLGRTLGVDEGSTTQETP